jgi:hypothetical protein
MWADDGRATPNIYSSFPARRVERRSVCEMGGYGSGRRGGGPTVESEFAFRIDIDALRRDGLIRLGVRGGCVIRFSHPYRDLDVECETHIGGPWDDWVRLKYEMTDYWTGEPLAIDDKIFLATSRPPFGGLRWWFVCPHLNRRVRKLYLPLGGRHFWSRRAYKLAYASQRQTAPPANGTTMTTTCSLKAWSSAASSKQMLRRSENRDVDTCLRAWRGSHAHTRLCRETPPCAILQRAGGGNEVTKKPRQPRSGRRG